MNKKLILFIILITSVFSSFAGEIVLEGIYQGKNIYVMNPFASSGVGFCIYEVIVNGQVSTDEINSSAFEIDLSVFQFNKGDKIIIIIKHKENCLPKILNPEVLKPKSTFIVSLIKVEKGGTLKWTTTSESGQLTYTVEQFRWNKWVRVGKVQGNGTSGTNNYSIKVKPHSGINKFRVKQIDYTKKPRYSKEATFRSMSPPVTYSPEKPTTEIVFSNETMYEIYDYYGNLVLKGFGAKINISRLKSDTYFINYDIKTETFKKK
ncbi:MAG: hypothetical protein KAT68_16390 [Bacteroidales bacterium]|nr:hypothetical protein [Bacteroidales bacterium]